MPFKAASTDAFSGNYACVFFIMHGCLLSWQYQRDSVVAGEAGKTDLKPSPHR